MRCSAGAPLRGRPASSASGSRIRRTEWRRLSAESGFWNTIWSARRSDRSSASGSAAAAPSRRARRPRSIGSTIPSSVRASVVLPLPDSPTRPSVSPGQIEPAHIGQRVHLVAVLRNTLAEVVEADDQARPPGRPAGSCEVGRLLAGELHWPGRGTSSGSRGRCRRPSSGRLLACGSGRRRARSGRRRRSPGARRRGSAGSRGSCRAVRGPCARRRAGCSAGARPCTDAAGRSAPLSTGPSSTRRPAYSTPTRSHIFAITPRLWLMKRTARLQLGLQLRDEVEHLGLDGRVEPGRRLVEDQQRRILRKRHRDHHPLLHAARELDAGSGPSPSRGRRSARARAHRGARSLRLAARDPAHRERLDDLRARSRMDGFSAAPGFW